MCLSKAYRNEVNEANVIGDMISSVGYRDNKIVLTDLLKREYVLEGTLETVDLMENYIIVRTKDSSEA